MSDTYENMTLSVPGDMMSEPGLYETVIPTANYRSQNSYSNMPNAVQSTSIGFHEACRPTTGVDQSVRYGGVSRPSPFQNEQQSRTPQYQNEHQSEAVEFRPEVSRQGKEKSVSSCSMVRIFICNLLVLSIALSVTLLVLFFVMGKNEEIKSLKATIEYQQANRSIQASEMQNMKDLIESLKLNYTALNSEAQAANKRLMEATDNITALRSTIKIVGVELNDTSEKLVITENELTKLNKSFHYYSRHPVRLEGSGSTSSKGRVEIFMYGSWGTVCDDGWDINDGNVVCKQLGFAGASRVVTQASDFGQGSGNIWLDNVACTGEESHISHCRYVMDEDCTHSEDAGVYCV